VLVDTSIVVAAFRRDALILQKLTTVQTIVSVTTVGELNYGAYRSTQFIAQTNKITGFLW
jgi:predicted nucleic acid-binding protein